VGLCQKPFDYGDRLKILFDEGGAKPISLIIDATASSGIGFGRRDGTGDLPWLGYDRRDDPDSQRKPTERNGDGNNPLIGPYHRPAQLLDLLLIRVTPLQKVAIMDGFIARSQYTKTPVTILDQRKLMIEPVKTRASVGTFANTPTDDMGLVYYWPILTVWLELVDYFYSGYDGTFSIYLRGTEADLSKGIVDRGTF
jgi:hypothetical protein